MLVQVQVLALDWHFGFAALLPSGSAFCFAGAGAVLVLVLVQALALDRRFVLWALLRCWCWSRDGITSCPE